MRTSGLERLKRFRALWLALALCLTLAVVVAGCGDDDDEGASTSGGADTAASTDGGGDTGGGEITAEPKKIGYIDTLYAAAAQQRCHKALEAAAEQFGWEVELQDAQGDPAKALTAAQNYVTQGVDAIVTGSMPKAFIAPALKAAQAKGIPTVVMCGGIGEDTSGYDVAYTEDETVLGEAMAQPLIDDLKESGGKNVVIVGDDVVDAGVKREAAFRKALAEQLPDAKILAAPKAVLTDPNGSVQKIMQDLTTQYPDIDAVFAVYDWMVPPIATVLRSRKLDDKIPVYAGYADLVNLPFLRNPKHPLKAVGEAPLAETALVTIDQLAALFEGGKELDPNAFDEIAKDLERYPAIRNSSPDVPEKPTSKDQLDDYQIANLDELMAPYIEKWQQEYGQ